MDIERPAGWERGGGVITTTDQAGPDLRVRFTVHCTERYSTQFLDRGMYRACSAASDTANCEVSCAAIMTEYHEGVHRTITTTNGSHEGPCLYPSRFKRPKKA
jgi:hypothetical protein